MAHEAFIAPVGDSVPKIDNELAVGEDLEFQKRWWRFEKVVWSLFLVIIMCDLAGLFGRGWLAKAEASTPDNALRIQYERVQRANTPSTLTMHFGSAAVRNGELHVFITDSIVHDLGAQRVAPQPAVSAVGKGGIAYSFPADGGTATVQIQLQPSAPGAYSFSVQPSGHATINARVLVLP